VTRVTYKIVDPAFMAAGRGPHPAASPFDKRLGEALGISAFDVYQVELPAWAETVQHDHRDDGAEDVYAILRGTGWLLVDDEEVPIGPGQFIAVTMESTRQIRADEEGLLLIALCAAPSSPLPGRG
jgi:mannose-6-phosphate isomerase-like protein (cupin superfamily)